MGETISVELFGGHVWDTGCYLNSSRGWRAIGHLVEYAANISELAGDGGYTLTPTDRQIVNAFLNGALVQLPTVDGGHIDVQDHVVLLSDNALDYLNSLARAAAERGEPECFWAWEDGELFFSPAEEDDDA